MTVYSASEPGAPGHTNCNPHMFAPEMIESGDLMKYPGIDRDQNTNDALWRKTMSILNEAEEQRFYADKTQNHGKTDPRSVAAGALYNAGKDVTDYLEKSRITQSEVAEASDTNVATVSRYSRELEEEGITGDSVEDLLDPGN